MKSNESHTSTVSSHWPGFSEIKHMIIFGDSYSSVGYSSTSRHPTLEEPLGVKFPGATFTERKKPNWVGYVAQKRKADDNPIVMYDYAVGGDMVYNVVNQVQDEFIPHLGPKPEWAPWKSTDTLFVTWVGINDCGFYHKHEHNIERLFRLQEELYEAGARNFLLIDVPPIHRAPLFANRQATGKSKPSASYEDWNKYLGQGLADFQNKYDDATLLLFSSWNTFSQILDSPEAFGFQASDVDKVGGAMWVDQLHPTSAVHAIIAKDVMQFLDNFSVMKTESGSC